MNLDLSSFWKKSTWAAFCCLAAPSLFATTFTVNIPGDTNLNSGGTFTGNSGDLRGVLNHLSVVPSGTYNIDFDLGGNNTITLGAMLPILNTRQGHSGNSVLIDGSNGGGANPQIVINGNNTYRGFFARQGIITIQNMTIQNVKAKGGDGGRGGGAGMGAGGALFIDKASVTLSNVTIGGGSAVGGNGALTGIEGGGGGGGMGGDGGLTLSDGHGYGGAGGGIGGKGGISTSFKRGSAGGGGINCGGLNTGRGGNHPFSTFGIDGGAGGSLGAGEGGSNGSSGGLFGGGGGAGGVQFPPGPGPSEDGTWGGGGGGGINGADGGNAENMLNGFGGNGGAGGWGGGGGAAGFGVNSSLNVNGGTGGFGGGGGGARIEGNGGRGGSCGIDGEGGVGGFGGGGGTRRSSSTLTRPGGVGGGHGGTDNSDYGNQGGGGAGFGGALFVNSSAYELSGTPGSLTILGPFNTTGTGSNTTTAGIADNTGATPPSPGFAAGNDAFFLTGTTITLDPNGNSITLYNSIADDSPASFLGAPTGVTAGTKSGATIIIGSILHPAGNVTLATANTYSGGTTFNKGTLAVQNNGSLGSGTLTFAGANTILQAGAGNLTLLNVIVLNASGSIESNGNTFTLSGNISGNGALTKQGTGTVKLSGTNSYSGETLISAGTLEIDTVASFPSGRDVNLLGATAILNLSTAGGNIVIGDLNGVSGSLVSIGTHNLAFGTATPTTTFAGNISGTSSALTKQGSGTAILTGTNNYSGGTTVSAGALQGTTSSLQGNILNNASLIFDQSVVGTYSGEISGTGSLTKQGSGTVKLSGNNTYLGGTIISAGTLEINTVSSLPSGTNVNLSGATGILHLNTGGGSITIGDLTGVSGSLLNLGLDSLTLGTTTPNVIFSGNFAGTGSINKAGSGRLILSGNSSHAGGVTVSAGALSVNGSITSPLTVLPSAALNGNGTITGDVVVGGLLGPGNSIGSLEVVGNITFQTGSTFEVELNPSTADFLDVDASGNITIEPNATLAVVPTPATYGVNMIYPVAAAGEGGGAVIGVFDNVANTFPLITAQVIYATTPAPFLEDQALVINAIDVILNYAPFSDVITSGNPGAIAASLDGFTPAPGSDMHNVIIQLYFLNNVETLKDAFNQMQPSILNSLSLAQQNSSLFVSSAFNKHTEDLRLTSSRCIKRLHNKWQLWGDGSVDWARERGNHANVGFHAKTQLGAGGIDYHISQQFYLGALGAYTHASVDSDDHLAQGRINTYYTGLYGSWLTPRFFANAFVLGSFSDFHSKRAVQFGTIHRHPEGHHRGYGGIAHFDLGACLPKERKAQYYPYGQLDYVYQHETGYTETAAQSLNNKIRGRNTAMLRTELGLEGRLCHSVGKSTLSPRAKLGWVRETRFQGEKINARLVDVPNRYTVIGLYPDRNLLILGTSVTAVYDSSAHLTLTYEGLFGSGYISNAGNISFDIRF